MTAGGADAPPLVGTAVTPEPDRPTAEAAALLVAAPLAGPAVERSKGDDEEEEADDEDDSSETDDESEEEEEHAPSSLLLLPRAALAWSAGTAVWALFRTRDMAEELAAVNVESSWWWWWSWWWWSWWSWWWWESGGGQSSWLVSSVSVKQRRCGVSFFS